MADRYLFGRLVCKKMYDVLSIAKRYNSSLEDIKVELDILWHWLTSNFDN